MAEFWEPVPTVSGGSELDTRTGYQQNLGLCHQRVVRVSARQCNTGNRLNRELVRTRSSKGGIVSESGEEIPMGYVAAW